MKTSPSPITPPASRRHLLRTGAAAVALAVGSPLLLAGCNRQAPQMNFKSTDLDGADYGKSLDLTNTATGKPVSLDTFKGKVVLLFFGFTQCPDICPTTLLKAKEIKEALGKDGDKLDVVFVTLDPERDTAEVMQAYVPSFDPSFIGLRGDPAATKKAAREFRVFYQKVPNQDGSSYTLDHTAASYVIDKDGKLRLLVRYTDAVPDIVSDLKQLIAA
jgi:hypothetical protein